MRTEALSFVRCPACGSELEFLGRPEGREFIEGELRCSSCHRSFRVRHGIPDFRLPDCFKTPNKLQKALYDVYAPFYDRLEAILGKMTGFSEPELREEIASFLELRSDSSVLEICVGTGGNLPYIRARTRGPIAGLDISEEMLKICQEKVDHMRLWPVDLFLGCAEYLPFKPGAFDRVLIGGGISYFGDVRRALSEAARVTADGGLVVVFEQVTLLERALGRADLPLRNLPSNLSPLERRWLFGHKFYLLKLVKQV